MIQSVNKRVFAIIDCSIPINTRNQKIINSIRDNFHNSEIHVITWNREGLDLPNDQYFHAYNNIAAYGNLKAKLFGMFGYKKYIGKILNQIKADVIIASHWSNLVLVSDYKEKNQLLIYENLDIPTGGFLIRHFASIFEKRALKKVDLIIHASRFFEKLYNAKIPQIVLENKPAFLPNRKENPIGNPMKVSFIGTVRYKDILFNVVDALKNNEHFELYFHGSGPDLNALKDYCKNIKNVYFTGKYDYSKVVSLYHQSDIVWAGYPNKDFNVVYAISNKFHESMYVGVPCVYSCNTELADFVLQENLGFVVNPYSSSDISELFNSIIEKPEKMNSVLKSMKMYQENESTWENDFIKLISFLNKK